ncbi:MAG TPA: class I SAM-dependent methyltransferase [Thermoanaerobaculales bacterium]|nr:class I SAM-dependent methyltransferase [Thermoanaerobaculales bacterium]HQN95735.1 class I SAM-dependent methyltransferase [Thermoanaerobaculales bacterium]
MADYSHGRYVGASADAIRAHYDRGKGFYELWLDESLTYSCALWRGAGSLEDAQVQKYDFHVELAEAAGSARVLDIGCGWGAMLQHLVSRHGVGHAVGLTLSTDQAEFVQGKATPGVEVRLQNWTDHTTDLPYDAVICIGMLEHCAHIDLEGDEKVAAYRRFFAKCHELLQVRRCLSLQTICFGTLRRLDAFIRDRIWPESNLPYLHEIVLASDQLFEIERLVSDGSDYARTCKSWADNLARRRDRAVAVAGEDVVSDYLRYLRMSARAFETGALCLYRIKMRRLGV